MRNYQIGLFLVLIIGSQIGTSAESSAFSENQICKAGIAIIMGRDPGTMTTKKDVSNVIFVSYIRQSDGNLFTYKCRINGNQIMWGNETGRWRDDSADSTVSYSISGLSLQVRDQFSDGSASEEIYTAAQLGPR